MSKAFCAVAAEFKAWWDKDAERRAKAVQRMGKPEAK
jgi:hypothetical protein